MLITLLISNNFVELKGSVFKKCERENLFQVATADIVERFQLSVYLSLVALQFLFVQKVEASAGEWPESREAAQTATRRGNSVHALWYDRL